MSRPLAPEIISIIYVIIETQLRVMVRLKVFTENLERDEIAVDYPVQGGRHMVALMRYSISKLIVGHGTMTEIRQAIHNIIGRNDDMWKLSN